MTEADARASGDAEMLESLKLRAREVLSGGDTETAGEIDIELAALKDPDPDLTILRVDIARLQRSRRKVRALTDETLAAWFDAEPPPIPTAGSGRMRGPALIDWLSNRATLVHHLARQILIDPNSFDKSAQPSIHGLRGCCVLPRADWSPVTPGGLVLSRGMAPDAREMAAVLGGDPTTGNQGLSLDDDIEIHTDQRIIVVGGSDNWYHFLLDYLPRLLAVMECGLLDAGWKVGIGRGRADLFAPAVEMLGIPDDWITWLDSDRAHFFPRALFISNFNLEALPHPLTLNLLQRFFQPKANNGQSPPGPKRLFVSRARIDRRRLTNEKTLHEGLLKRGFHIIHSESQSLGEQIATFQNARHIVGVHGSALTNMVWCRELKGMLELASSPSGISWRNTDPHFSVLSRAMSTRHQRLRASAEETERAGDHMSDFTLRPEAVFQAIDTLLAETDA
jgi:capsular polysaccharide biosynthesis protein